MKKGLMIVFAAVLAVALAAPGAFAEGKLGAFAVKTGDGKDFNNKSIENTSLFLIMQTACNQCRTELEDLVKAGEEVTKKANVYVVLVDMNTERAMKYYNDKGYQFPVLLDSSFVIGSQANLSATPATLIVDKDGNIKYTKTGYRGGDFEKIKAAL